ncbi:GNAT family N-acetyltransferase, partial [Lactobacillus taiwanensis]
MEKVSLTQFTENSLKEVWQQGFSVNQPAWTKFNAPYFNDYQKFTDFKSFKESSIAKFLLSEECRCITVNNQPIGMVSKDWINEQTRWLEIGIVI